jgi:hypothetical protein
MNKLLISFIFIVLFSGGVLGLGSSPTIDFYNMSIYYKFNNDNTIGENSTYVVDLSGVTDENQTDPETGLPLFNYNLTHQPNNGIAKSMSFYNVSGGYFGDGAYEFNNSGSGQGISIANSKSINMTTGFTIMAWVRIYDNSSALGGSSDDMTIFSKGNRLFHLSIASSRKLVTGTSGLTDNTISSNSKKLENGIWYHIAFTYNGTQICDYVNGTVDDCDPSTGNLTTSIITAEKLF